MRETRRWFEFVKVITRSPLISGVAMFDGNIWTNISKIKVVVVRVHLIAPTTGTRISDEDI